MSPLLWALLIACAVTLLLWQADAIARWLLT